MGDGIGDGTGTGNGNRNGTVSLNGPEEKDVKISTPWRKTLPVLLVQVSIFQTMAGPFGFLALRHISYPTMVLGKVSHTRYSD